MAIMIVSLICALVAVYATVRILFEKSTQRKLIYLNLLNFAITGVIVFVVGTLVDPWLAIAAAAAYFVGATLESNAIASTLAQKEDRQ
jgi:energy-converting hydrogenase A subunit C